MSGISVNVKIAQEHLGPTLNAIAIKYGGRSVGSSGTLFSFAIPPERLEAFCLEAESNQNVISVETNPSDAREKLKKVSVEGRKELLKASEPDASLITHLVYSHNRMQRMDVTLINGIVYADVEHDFHFKDGISVVYNSERYYIPLSSIVSIKIRSPKT